MGTQFEMAFLISYMSVTLFVVSEFIELYFTRQDVMQMLFNVSVSKTVFFIIRLPHWRALIENISAEERNALKSKDSEVKKLMGDYIIYSRLITVTFWSVIALTIIVTILAAFIKYVTVPVYRDDEKRYGTVSADFKLLVSFR